MLIARPYVPRIKEGNKQWKLRQRGENYSDYAFITMEVYRFTDSQNRAWNILKSARCRYAIFRRPLNTAQHISLPKHGSQARNALTLTPFKVHTVSQWTGKAYSVQRLCTGWAVRGSNAGGSEIFRTPPDRHWGNPACYIMCTGSLRGVKWPGRGVNHLPSYSNEIKDRVELHLYSPSVPPWQVIGWILYVYLYLLVWVTATPQRLKICQGVLERLYTPLPCRKR